MIWVRAWEVRHFAMKRQPKKTTRDSNHILSQRTVDRQEVTSEFRENVNKLPTFSMFKACACWKKAQFCFNLLVYSITAFSCFTYTCRSTFAHRSRIRYLSKKNSRILTNYPKFKKFVKIRTKIR